MEMKKICYLVILAFLGTVNFCKAQWVQQTSGTNQTLNSVFCIKPDTVFAVGTTSTILKTTDGGNSWSSLYPTSIITTPFNSVYFVTSNIGYVAGKIAGQQSGTYVINILKTIDGGASWTAINGIYGSNQGVMTSIYFNNVDTGYVVGYGNAGIWKTIDGGNTWSIHNNGPAYSSVFFPSLDTGYVCSGLVGFPGGKIYKTFDAGTNWTQQLNITNPLNSIYFVNNNLGFSVGYAGTFYKTIDGGANWNPQSLGTTTNLKSVRFIGANVGYIVGDSGLVLKTIDGGVNWITQNSTTSNGLKSVFFADANTGYAVGVNGTIIKTTSTTVLISENYFDNNITISPNPFSTETTISFSSEQKNTTIKIVNVLGCEILRFALNDKSTTIDLSDVAKGIYFVRIEDEKKNVVNRKIVVQ